VKEFLLPKTLAADSCPTSQSSDVIIQCVTQSATDLVTKALVVGGKNEGKRNAYAPEVFLSYVYTTR
jgi:hypothetical protein